MSNDTMKALETATHTFSLNSDVLRKHWQGHRELTRRVIEAFPEKELFHFSIGGMRPFSELALEMINMGGPGVIGLATNQWKTFSDQEDSGKDKLPKTKQDLLNKWDEVTRLIDEYWPAITSGRFQETTLAFGQYEGPVYQSFFYFVDNEIHHRGQGYVYLRALGIEPPPFWDRH